MKNEKGGRAGGEKKDERSIFKEWDSEILWLSHIFFFFLNPIATFVVQLQTAMAPSAETHLSSSEQHEQKYEEYIIIYNESHSH